MYRKPISVLTRNALKFIIAFVMASLIYLLLFWTQSSGLKFGDPESGFKVEQRLQIDKNRYSKISIAVKTGNTVALERTPSQLLTFLSHVDNVILVGDQNQYVGNTLVYDVIANISKEFKSRHQKREINDESSKQDSNAIGWKTDTHKNLPAYKLLFESFPDSNWFLMIDDDTYILMDNLLEMLQKYNHLDDHYFGLANLYAGCGGLTKFSNDHLFAHGGSGIVISRGAMLKMYPTIDECIIESENCWAGDIRIALCLRKLGIKIQGLRNFNIDPPNDQYQFTEPCNRPVTFHHLLGKQVQKLYDLERNIGLKWGKRDVTMADVASHFLSKNILADTNRPGTIYATIEAKNIPDCQGICQKQKGCITFTFEQMKEAGKCHLMDYIPRVGKEKGIGNHTGVLPSKFECKRTWRTILKFKND